MHSPELLKALLGVGSVVSSVATTFKVETREEFLQRSLPLEMRKHRGKKRLRKKKALKELLLRWKARMMAIPISQRLDYGAIGKMLFQVQPLPPPVSGAMNTYTFNKENS